MPPAAERDFGFLQADQESSSTSNESVVGDRSTSRPWSLRPLRAVTLIRSP